MPFFIFYGGPFLGIFLGPELDTRKAVASDYHINRKLSIFLTYFVMVNAGGGMMIKISWEQKSS